VFFFFFLRSHGKICKPCVFQLLEDRRVPCLDTLLTAHSSPYLPSLYLEVFQNELMIFDAQKNPSQAVKLDVTQALLMTSILSFGCTGVAVLPLHCEP